MKISNHDIKNSDREFYKHHRNFLNPSTMAVDSYSSNLATLSYPRTGKRGVPQQFARRLYEMLQSEAKIASETKEPNAYISWSQSGFAFRIIDVEGFTSSVLPKYFRTKKFSSFQRNLNLVSLRGKLDISDRSLTVKCQPVLHLS